MSGMDRRQAEKLLRALFDSVECVDSAWTRGFRVFSGGRHIMTVRVGRASRKVSEVTYWDKTDGGERFSLCRTGTLGQALAEHSTLRLVKGPGGRTLRVRVTAKGAGLDDGGTVRILPPEGHRAMLDVDGDRAARSAVWDMVEEGLAQ